MAETTTIPDTHVPGYQEAQLETEVIHTLQTAAGLILGFHREQERASQIYNAPEPLGVMPERFSLSFTHPQDGFPTCQIDCGPVYLQDNIQYILVTDTSENNMDQLTMTVQKGSGEITHVTYKLATHELYLNVIEPGAEKPSAVMWLDGSEAWQAFFTLLGRMTDQIELSQPQIDSQIRIKDALLQKIEDVYLDDLRSILPQRYVA